MSIVANDGRAPVNGEFSPLRALNERRVSPGTLKRENIDTPSPLLTLIPRGKDNSGPSKRQEVKR